jgi:hypothetical protein
MHASLTGNPFVDYPVIFWRLLSGPWANLDIAWGIIPLYLSWLLGELYEPKPSPKNAVQGGANLLWAGIDWGRVSLMPILGNILDLWYAFPQGQRWAHFGDCLAPLWRGANTIIFTTTVCTLLLGIVSILMCLRKRRVKLKKYFRHLRLSSYLVIMLYPLQTDIIPWMQYGWHGVGAIVFYSIPVWLVLSLIFQVLLKLK